MRISATIFLTDETITPTRLARELEQRGFAGLYLPEHTHIPVERTTPYPAGGDLPPEYGRTLDPFVALGQAAAVTERLGLGTGITLVAQHDPIDLAKQIATLDHLSGGPRCPYRLVGTFRTPPAPLDCPPIPFPRKGVHG